MAPRPRPAIKKEKQCIFCKEVKPADAFFRHNYKLRSGEESTRFMSGCKECNSRNRQALRDSRYTPEQRERNAKKRALRPQISEYQRRYRKDKPAKNRSFHLLRKFGITVDEYEAIAAKQDGKCAVCRRPPLPEGRYKHLVVDHCHSRNKVRGLLCHNCNVSLGLLGENVERIRALAGYLERNGAGKDSDSSGLGSLRTFE